MTLRRKLGLSTVLAIVMGDMIGSGIFFTPGELAAVAMGIGVVVITLIYMLVNYAFLRVVPLEAMRVDPTLVAPTVAKGTGLSPIFRAIAHLSAKKAVPSGAIAFAAVVSLAALLFFGSFSRIVAFFVVRFQIMNILMVSSIFKLRRLARSDSCRLPGYPLVPAIYMSVMSLFLIAALVYNPLDSLIGIALTLAGAPVYWRLSRNRSGESHG